MKKYCIDCNRRIDLRSNHCIFCFQLKERNHTWKGGKPKCMDCGKLLHSYNAKRCCSCNGKNQSKILKKKLQEPKNNPNWKGGKPQCVDCNKLLSSYNTKRCRKCYTKFNVGKNHPFYRLFGKLNPLFGKKRPNHAFRMKGKNNPNWQNGISFLPYSHDWTIELKAKIRKRDNHICQRCNLTEKEHLIRSHKILSIHHIDYNKQNCKENNLMTLCIKCNSEANKNRDYWFAYYMYIIKTKFIKEQYNGNSIKDICK